MKLTDNEIRDINKHLEAGNVCDQGASSRDVSVSYYHRSSSHWDQLRLKVLRFSRGA